MSTWHGPPTEGAHLLDLGIGDVHIPSATPQKPSKEKTMAEITSKPTAKRAGKKKGEKLPPRKRGLHVRADLAEGGSLHVRHMSDGTDVVFFPTMPLSASDD